MDHKIAGGGFADTDQKTIDLMDEACAMIPTEIDLMSADPEGGRLTDSQSRTADFKYRVIIMTRNIGSHSVSRIGALGFI